MINRSKGAILLARIGVTQEEMAAETGIHQTRISNYLTGIRKPGPGRRRLFLRRYKVPIESWDEAPDAKATLARTSPSPAPPPVVDVQARALRLQSMVDETLDRVMRNKKTTPLERTKVLASAATTIAVIGKLTGDAQQISEQRIARLPAWRRIKDEMMRALTPWPDAMRAVGEALVRLDG